MMENISQENYYTPESSLHRTKTYNHYNMTAFYVCFYHTMHSKSYERQFPPTLRYFSTHKPNASIFEIVYVQINTL